MQCEGVPLFSFPFMAMSLSPSKPDAFNLSAMSQALFTGHDNESKGSHSPEKHSIESLYAAGEDEMDCPFQDPSMDESMIACKSKLHSSFDDEAPTYASASSALRRSRAQHNRSVGTTL
mmetsp:Transcript_20532/g.49002  ORF Transcript_20532/g.49002 Transcript_20532/m.49002 type:complete len:119 (-) Transcript_20532:108-464(-)